MKYFITLIIPFFGTSIGSFLCYFINTKINDRINKCILGLSAGVMMASSIWSLIIPAVNYSKNKYYGALLVSIGLFIGLLFYIIMDIKFIKYSKKSLNLAVVIHNIPEGFCVGLGIAYAVSSHAYFPEAFALSLGIGIQNIPEGSIISLSSLKNHSRTKSFFYGVLSGAVEPISSIIAILLMLIIKPLMPIFLSFAAGIMIYVVINDLILECHSKLGNLFFFIGFTIMMILDIIL